MVLLGDEDMKKIVVSGSVLVWGWMKNFESKWRQATALLPRWPPPIRELPVPFVLVNNMS